MSKHQYEPIENRLQPPPTPEPPADLLEKVQRDIPEYLSVVPETNDAGRPNRHFKLIAAAVVLVVLGGTVAFRLSREAPRLEEQIAIEELSALSMRSPVPAAEPPGVVEEAPPAAATPNQSTEPERQRQAIARDDSIEATTVEAGELEPPRRKNELDEGVRRERRAIQEVETPAAEIEGRRSVAESPPAIEVTDRDLRLGQAENLQALGPELEARVGAPGDGLAMRIEPPAAPPSTGGTAEPNDAPYGDMFFRAYGTNPFIDTEDDPLSTFGLDVDTGSFTLARSYLDRGHLPPAEAIRVEEFVNYFDYADPAPRRGEFTLVAEGAPSPFAEGPRYQLVRFGIQARTIRAAERQPAVLIFVVDVSGSMQRENRLGLVKRSLELLLDELDREDEIGLVVYGSRGQVLLEPTRSQESIRRAIERLVPGGSTNAEEGLDLAYELARRYYREGAIHRLILCSDGVANVGRTGPESILARVRGAADDGIELTTVGFGMGNYNDLLMEQLADQGDGAYAYVDNLAEARRIFVENLSGMLQTIARDAKVQVEFNPEVVSRYRLLGYENRDIADERFRDDSVDAGEIGAGHAVTALYEIKLAEDVGRHQRLATLRLRYHSVETNRIVETAIDLDRKQLASSWERGSTALRLSSLAAEFAEILKGSYWAKWSDLDDLYRRLRPVADELAGDERVEELLYLVERARRLRGSDLREVDE